MDLAKILKDAGADKPKQTRPEHAKWQHNTVQVRLSKDVWVFFNVMPRSLPYGTEDLAEVQELGFVDGKLRLVTLQTLYPKYEFRLVSILEVS